MMKEILVTEKVKARFCKDVGIHINIFKEPYFSDRIRLMGVYDKYEAFVDMFYNEFNGDDSKFLDYGDRVVAEAITYIKESKAYKLFNSVNMNKYKCFCDVKQSNIWSDQYVGKRLISIDISKANFSGLVHFSKTVFEPLYNNFDYKEFMGRFTDIDYFKESKIIREVIFSKTNPGRQVAYEKYIVDCFVGSLKMYKDTENIKPMCQCLDEVFFDADELTEEQKDALKNRVEMYQKRVVPMKYSEFKLGKIVGTDGYIKEYIDGCEGVDFKCITPLEYPFVYRKHIGMEPCETDKYFSGENGRLCMLVEPVEVAFRFDKIV